MFTKKETKKVGEIYRPQKVGNIHKTEKKTNWDAIFWTIGIIGVLIAIAADGN